MESDPWTIIPPDELPLSSSPAITTWQFRTLAADPAMARLSILVEVVEGMDPEDRPAALTYLRLRFMRGFNA